MEYESAANPRMMVLVQSLSAEPLPEHYLVPLAAERTDEVAVVQATSVAASSQASLADDQHSRSFAGEQRCTESAAPAVPDQVDHSIRPEAFAVVAFAAWGQAETVASASRSVNHRYYS